MFLERTVVQVNGVNVDIDVIVKDAEIEMNNNNDVPIKLTEKLIQSEDSMVKTMSESVSQTDEMVKNEAKLAEIETVSESSSVNTDNGDDASEQKEPMTEGDSKVEHETSSSESSDEKSETTEPSEPSEPSSYTTGSETKDETPLESSESSGNSSETSTENTTENTVDTSEQSKVVEPSEQSGDNEHQKEIKKEEEEEEGTVTAAEPKDDAQPMSEQKGDDANKSMKSESSKRSPRKKGSNKKRKNRSRSQKKEDDYSEFDKYTVSVSHRQRRYSLHVTRGRVIQAPGDDCEIFCSNIPINVLEGELIPLFERYGKIWELRLMMSLRNPKRNAGFAFVRYTSNASAQEATEKLNSYEILPGKHLAIRLSQPNLSLFVGNIHRGLTREQIHEKISSRTTGKHSIS